MSRRKHRNRVPYDQRFGPWDDNWARKECDATYQLEQHIASLHREKSPEELAALYAEWGELS